MSTYAPPTYIPVNAAVPTEGVTVSFSEESKGWISFKSFIQDGGLSLNNCYYTFKNTAAVDANGNFVNSDFLIWKHHDNEVRNNFYGKQFDSHVDVLFNEESATVKSFASMKYEGSQSKITQDLTDPSYFNNVNQTGWYVEKGITDLQESGEMEFKSKEGKWFSYMKGKDVTNVEDLNSKEFSFQGIDILQNAVCTNCVDGCVDPTALNYDPQANTNDGSCKYPPYSCWHCLGDGCVEDTNPLNGPCNDYATKEACEAACRGGGGERPRYTLTIDDSTPSQQQIGYSVSTFTKTNILGDTVIHHFGTGIFPDSEYRLEISADTGYIVRASDFAIEFPIGVTPAATSLSGGTPSSTPFFYIDDFTGSQQNLGQGYDLGTGPLVYMVMFKDSENPTHDANWAGPSASNKVIVDCFIGTDMDDNIPGAPNWPTNMEVYMTHNGMSSSNAINPGIPGDLNIFINIIGKARLSIGDPVINDPTASGPCNGYYNSNALHGPDGLGTHIMEIYPSHISDDLPYTYEIKNITTGVLYTHWHGPNPNGGYGTGQANNPQYSPATKYKDIPAGTYEFKTTTASGCVRTEILILENPITEDPPTDTPKTNTK